MVCRATVGVMVLVYLSATCCLCGADGETKSTPGSAGGEGVVQEYILARVEAENELEDFYRTAPPGALPDLNTDTMLELERWREKVKGLGLPEEDLADLLTGDPGLPQLTGWELPPSGLETRKRSITANTRRRWFKVIVPFVYTDQVNENGRNEIMRSMRTFERHTCARFVPWEEDEEGETTNDKLELGHPSYAKFVAEGGCWSYVGNIWRSSGQTISCCGGSTCIHELGHMFGEYHEQQTPSPDRNRFIRINYHNIQTDGQRWYRQSGASHVLNSGYDLNSPMHYATWMFGNRRGPTFARLFPELHERGGFYYLMKEVSEEHGCQDQCADSNLVCENDGYLTKVDNKCTCRCIPGLDPTTGCTTILKADPPGLEFPGGKWAMPAHKSGCPDGFLTGSWTQTNNGGNVIPNKYDLKGSFTDNTLEQHFCVRDSPETEFYWPGANMCVYRKGGKCPEGFIGGYVQFDDTPGAGTQTGDLPDGVFDEDTRLEFCCQSKGFSQHPLHLPSRKPFTLIHNAADSCHQVRGMHSREMVTQVTNVFENDATNASSEGYYPAGHDERHSYFRTRYCSYYPAKIDCGDIINLDANNPEVTISSPSGSELECFWLIKAPQGERLQMDFTNFSIAGTPGRCRDDLEVRYSRQGQPGMWFCGQSYEKTTISINNTLHIRLSTYGDSISYFTAKIKLIQDSQLCYQADDMGMTYAGDVNITRDFEPCLPWHEVSHCPHHPFNTDIFNTILLGNACRNPDPSRGFQPWCYTEKSQCERNYCDVCQIGTLYDSRRDCADLKSKGLCDVSVCAKTCFDTSPVIVPASEVSCPTPGDAPDGVVEQTKTSYGVGERVSYRCNYNNSTRDRVCLSTGQWSTMGQVCSVCDSGWHEQQSTQLCLSPVYEPVHFAEAKATCAKFNGLIAMAKTEEQNNYLKSLTGYHGDMWLGLSDLAEEGTWLWEDGDTLNYTDWYEGEPNNWGGNENCGVMNRRGYWNDIPCTGYARAFVCEAPHSELQDCLDFSEHCSELFQLRPSMCDDFPAFAEEQCRLTCGRCVDTDSPTMCSLDELNPHVMTQKNRTEIPIGASVTYWCDETHVKVAGDLVRGCAVDGSLTGTPLQCVENCPEGWSFLEEEMACYAFLDIQTSGEDAPLVCASQGAMLAMSKSLAENDMLQSLRRADAWIALNDTSNEGNFVWHDGSPLIYTRWNSGEPNDWGYGEDCVVMRGNGNWDDRRCSWQYPVLCKKALLDLTSTQPPTMNPTQGTTNDQTTLGPTTMRPTTMGPTTMRPTTMKPATTTSTTRTTDVCED